MNKKKDTGVIFFMRYPKKGTVKHRLAENLNEEIVFELYRCFVQDTLITLQKLDTALLICYTPVQTGNKIHEWLGSAYRYIPQQGNNLGERMKNSFCSAFTEGFRRVILIGSDSPDIPRDFLKSALTLLQTHDIVLGPSSDGGYYLIGFRNDTFEPSVFHDISWSSTTVFQETITKIKKAHRSVCLLPIWSDIDTIADLKNLMKRNSHTAFKSSHTITYMKQQKILMENDHAEMPTM